MVVSTGSITSPNCLKKINRSMHNEFSSQFLLPKNGVFGISDFTIFLRIITLKILCYEFLTDFHARWQISSNFLIRFRTEKYLRSNWPWDRSTTFLEYLIFFFRFIEDYFLYIFSKLCYQMSILFAKNRIFFREIVN